MSGGVVCYIERAESGSVLTRVRLMAIGLSRSWTAPEEAGELSGSVPSGALGGGPALASIKSAARWVAETLASVGIKKIACVCIDADGSICAWLSSPSAEQQVIEATILQAGHEGEQHAGIGAGRLLAMAAPGGTLGLGADTSIQALASEEPHENGVTEGRPKRLLGRAGSPQPGTSTLRRNRYAVLAVPDAPVRVFLDELDTRGIEVQAVKSLWHAMAASWTEPEAGGPPGELVSNAAPTTAIVLIESPNQTATGRLVWAWSKAGELLAGGTMRLKRITQRAEESARTDLAPSGTEARRIEREEPAEETTQVEFSRAEAGRIAIDWLAWCAQLGHCPSRIVLLTPPEATDEEGSGPTALGRHLVAAWPNATIDAAVYDDPTSVTIARLAGVRNAEDSEIPEPLGGAGDDHAQGRAALVGLSARPGRADRNMHRWAALGLVGAAVVVGVLGWRLRSGAQDLLDRDGATAKETVALLAGIEPQVPGVTKFPPKQQQESLEAKRNELRDQAKKIRPPKPVLEEMVRLLAALDIPDPMEVGDLKIGFVSGGVTVEVPDGPKAAEVGPKILERLQASSGLLSWQGQSTSFASSAGKRRYVLTGIWAAEDVGGTGK